VIALGKLGARTSATARIRRDVHLRPGSRSRRARSGDLLRALGAAHHSPDLGAASGRPWVRARRETASQRLEWSLGDLAPRLRPLPRRGGQRGAGEQPALGRVGSGLGTQVLLRARVSAGDRELGARVVELGHVAAYERGAPRSRRCTPEAPYGAGTRQEHPGRFDLKTGRGGLLDIEFVAQWLQMRHGRDQRVRTTDTSEALEVLEELGILPTTTRDPARWLLVPAPARAAPPGSARAGTGRIDENGPGSWGWRGVWV